MKVDWRTRAGRSTASPPGAAPPPTAARPPLLDFLMGGPGGGACLAGRPGDGQERRDVGGAAPGDFVDEVEDDEEEVRGTGRLEGVESREPEREDDAPRPRPPSPGSALLPGGVLVLRRGGGRPAPGALRERPLGEGVVIAEGGVSDVGRGRAVASVWGRGRGAGGGQGPKGRRGPQGPKEGPEVGQEPGLRPIQQPTL